MASPASQPGQDIWSEMRLHSGPDTEYAQSSERYARQDHGRSVDEGELFPEGASHYEDSFDSRDPLRSATVEPVQHLPANLIEFPRELVATRKVRPRLAEGPFYSASHESSQLSIFEVDPDLLAQPAYPASSAQAVAPPEWASIELDHLDYLDHPEQHAGERHSTGGADHQVYVEHHYATEVNLSEAETAKCRPLRSKNRPCSLYRSLSSTQA